MVDKIEVTIDVIIHATEDSAKFYEAFEEMFGIVKDEFSVQNLVGHYENPIIMINAKITKNAAKQFMENFVAKLSDSQTSEIMDELEDRVSNSTLHLRLDKQELINENIVLKERDPVKLRIHTPIYSKKDTVKIFKDIFHYSN